MKNVQECDLCGRAVSVSVSVAVQPVCVRCGDSGGPRVQAGAPPRATQHATVTTLTAERGGRPLILGLLRTTYLHRWSLESAGGVSAFSIHAILLCAVCLNYSYKQRSRSRKTAGCSWCRFSFRDAMPAASFTLRSSDVLAQSPERPVAHAHVGGVLEP